MISELEHQLGQPVDVDEVAQEIEVEIRAAIAAGVHAMDGAVELLEALRGSRPLTVASNGSRETVEASLKAAAIPEVFDAVVTLEHPLRPKPAPDLYLCACERMRVPPGRCIAVEDSVPGARSARAAGLTVVGMGPAPGLGAVADALVPSLSDARLLDLLGLETLQAQATTRGASALGDSRYGDGIVKSGLGHEIPVAAADVLQVVRLGHGLLGVAEDHARLAGEDRPLL